eukprot:11572723-Alexandrium_andersonii.AAC.1
MAAKSKPGGGVMAGHGAQKENFHRRSDAFRFLEQQNWEGKFYPIKERGCLLSRDVTIFRGTERDGYPFLDQPFK